MASIGLDNVTKRYGNVTAVNDISLEIRDKEFVALVGPSGCGKTTTLRMIAGLEDITEGEISIADRIVNMVHPKNRDIAMVFQNYALYPHMSVFKNISFGLRARRLPTEEVREKTLEAAKILDLTELLERRPGELSGGQRQRVAMGRAIVREPKVFLFDEPLSNLDAKLRHQMRTEIKKLHHKVQTTVVYVTHDQVEAMTLADRIVIMRGGNIEQVGSPLEVFHQPVNVFVAGFIGTPAMNFLPATLAIGDGSAEAVLSDGETRLPLPGGRAGGGRDGQAVILGLRPDDIETKPGESGDANGGGVQLPCTANVVEPLGSEALVFFDLAGKEITGHARGMDLPRHGAPITVSIDMDRAHLFDAESEVRL